MKKFYQLLAICLVLSATLQAQKFDSFGEKISSDNKLNAKQLSENDFAKNQLKIEGEVESVCQAAGCWMKLKMADGQTMRVTFKDYAFFVPKDITGKKVIIEGVPEIKETSVEMLKHYAQDAGKSKSEIDAIAQPKKEFSFEAKGVLIAK